MGYAILGLAAFFVAFVLPIILYFQLNGLSARIAKLERALAEGVTPTAPSVGEAASGPASRPPPPEAAPTARPAPPVEEPAKASRPEPPALAKATPQKTKKMNLESRLGARWTVILGGIAIALGILFLVRYTIEAGLLGPAARIALGTLFSLALLGAGEVLRRRDQKFKLPQFPGADIPGIITAAGIVGAFGTLYAAHALYGFVGPALAFIGLTLVGLASLALSAVHGPKLAAIGLIGAYAAPILVSSDAPNPIALLFHVIAVTAAIMGVARIRQWLWLGLGGVIGALIWAILFLNVQAPAAPACAALLLVALGFLFAGAFGVPRSGFSAVPADTRQDRIGFLVMTALALVYVVHAIAHAGFPEVAAGAALALIMAGAAALFPAVAAISIIGGLVAVIAVLAVDLEPVFNTGRYLYGETDLAELVAPADFTGYAMSVLLITVPSAGVALVGAWRAAAKAPGMAGYLASALAIIAIGAIIGAWLRIAPFANAPGMGALALLVAGGAIMLTELFARKRPQDWSAGAPAAFATAAVALIAFGVGVVLTKSWIPLALALTCAGIAYIHAARPVKALPWLAVGTAFLSLVALLFSIPFDADAVGRILILNWLIVLAGLPAIATLWAGAQLNRNLTGSVTSALVTAFGLALLALFVSLQLRHLITGGQINNGDFTLADMAAQTGAALGFTLGLQEVARRTGRTIFSRAVWVAGLASCLMIAIGLFLVYNPALTNSPVGATPLFNLILPAYLVPGLLCAAIALKARDIRPRWYVLTYAFLGALLIFAFFTLANRQFFQGSQIWLWRSTSDLEFWSYSALWLVLSVALLVVGTYFASRPLRIGSAIMMALTVGKVFLLDVAELGGPLRAAAFMGLGLSLLAIGRFYQKYVVAAPGEPDDDPSTPDAEPVGPLAGS
ncbi:MAG: DUF2339 domain-containing protein [Pseudomonadota bacterium]